MIVELLSIVIPILVIFVAGMILYPVWIKLARANQFIGKDMNKVEKPRIAELGGVVTIISLIAGLSIFGAFNWNDAAWVKVIMGTGFVTVNILIVGFIDGVLGWKQGIRQRYKPMVTLLACIPVLFLVDQNSIDLPFYGSLKLGHILFFIIAPIAVMGTSNAYNMLAGYNGLEGGMGVVVFSGFLIAGAILKNELLMSMSILVIASLIVFLKFNWYPAEVFPGDALTYPVGGLIGLFAIIFHMEFFSVILFVPYFINALMSGMKKFNVEAFATPDRKNNLSVNRNGMAHIMDFGIVFLKKTGIKAREYNVVVWCFIVEAVFVGLGCLYVGLS